MPTQQLSPEEKAARDARLRKLAEEQAALSEQRKEEHRRLREERLYARRRGR